jgi:hypothetical protein
MKTRFVAPLCGASGLRPRRCLQCDDASKRHRHLRLLERRVPTSVLLLENGREDERTPVRAIGGRATGWAIACQFRTKTPPRAGGNVPVGPFGGRLSDFGCEGLTTRTAEILTESLILAQDERWRRASHMQVERDPTRGNTREDRVANGCVTREKPAPVSGITVGNHC